MSLSADHASPILLSKRVTCKFPLIRLTAAVLALATGGCVSSNEATVPPAPSQDAVYAPVLERWTRKANVFSQFQNRIEVSAVLLADEMRRAVGERLSRLRGSSDGVSVLTDSSGGARLGVLVSVYTPENPYLNLDDKTLWSLSLRIGPTQQPPMYVRRVFDKTTLEPFFSHIHRWSQDYLIVFDFPESSISRDPQTQQQVTAAEFVAQSAIARVAIRWP